MLVSVIAFHAQQAIKALLFPRILPPHPHPIFHPLLHGEKPQRYKINYTPYRSLNRAVKSLELIYRRN